MLLRKGQGPAMMGQYCDQGECKDVRMVQTADELGRKKAQERFLQLKAAYEVLRDPQMRREYDAGRMSAAA